MEILNAKFDQNSVSMIFKY